jgi:integrase
MAQVAQGIERQGRGLRIRIYFKGTAYTETDVGPCDNAHIIRAVKRREWLLSRLRVGLPIVEGDQRLLGEVAKSYFDSLAVKTSTLRSYMNIWKAYWEPRFTRLSPDVLTTAMIRKALSDIEVSVKTKKNALIVLSGILRHADVNPNPCSPIRFKRDQKQKIERYTPEEWQKLLSRLEGGAKVYFSLLRATGLRPGEAIALEWSDYSGEEISVTKAIVRGSLVSTKTNTARKVYVPNWARSCLDQHVTRFAGKQIFLNTQGNRHCDTNDLNKAWKKAHVKARVPYRIPYTLRHTRAAELLSPGASVPLAAKQLGHSVQMFLNTYSEYMEVYSDEDIRSLDRRKA